MMTRREMSATVGASLVALLSGVVASSRAEAAQPQNTAEDKPLNNPHAIPNLMQESIGDIGDAEASMLILNIPPAPPAGQHHRRFPMHKHSGPVFAYVLEGSVENQVDPDEPKTYNTGDYWYEPAMHVHRSLRNLSDTQPARILVFEVLPKDKPPAYSVQ
ncbi:MAG TPA: cupin domain-containing protein [Candidatus Baltobacteraceae bacterium]|nr:cupin domain-containing protein [Candidatus Baltobacteraceae bacterium]